MSYTSSYSTFNPACMSLVPVIASYNTAGEIGLYMYGLRIFPIR